MHRNPGQEAGTVRVRETWFCYYRYGRRVLGRPYSRASWAVAPKGLKTKAPGRSPGLGSYTAPKGRNLFSNAHSGLLVDYTPFPGQRPGLWYPAPLGLSSQSTSRDRPDVSDPECHGTATTWFAGVGQIAKSPQGVRIHRTVARGAPQRTLHDAMSLGRREGIWLATASSVSRGVPGRPAQDHPRFVTPRHISAMRPCPAQLQAPVRSARSHIHPGTGSVRR